MQLKGDILKEPEVETNEGWIISDVKVTPLDPEYPHQTIVKLIHMPFNKNIFIRYFGNKAKDPEAYGIFLEKNGELYEV